MHLQQLRPLSVMSMSGSLYMSTLISLIVTVGCCGALACKVWPHFISQEDLAGNEELPLPLHSTNPPLNLLLYYYFLTFIRMRILIIEIVIEPVIQKLEFFLWL